MIRIKKPEDIEKLRESGKHLATLLTEIAKLTVVGAIPRELDLEARRLTKEWGDTSPFLNYRAAGGKPFPAALCISVNHGFMHGLPGNEPLKEGDIVSLDGGISHKGMITDSAITVGVGTIDAKGQKLIDVTRQALAEGIKAARKGNTVGDIGAAIEAVVLPARLNMPVEFGGHGVGYEVHEDPQIPNFGEPGRGEPLRPGMVIAIEPLVTEGSGKVRLGADGFTIETSDGARAAHFEHTILITDGEPEILTRV